MSRHAHLAIDLGAESGRAFLGVLDGEDLALHELHRFTNEPRRLSTGLHWEIDRLWAHLREGARRAVRAAHEQGADLLSLGVDTWGVDYGLLDDTGRLLEDPHCYRDERNRAAFDKLLASIGRAALYEATGIQFMDLNTLVQLVAAREADPALIDRANTLLFMPDLMHHFFTGRAVAEATIASTSQIVDPRTGDWAVELVEAAGLPAKMLPGIVPAGSTIAPLRADVAREIEAPQSLRVIAPAAHDTASAVAAVPAEETMEWCYLSSGTWSLLGAELRRPHITDAARDVPFTNEGGVDGTIRFLKNIVGLWLVQECRRQLAETGESCDYDTLTKLAEASEAFRTIIDTSHAPFAAPGRMLDRIRAYARATRQPEPATPGQFVRCCLESLALAYRHTLGQLEDVLDRRFEVMHVIGGGGRNRLLNQMTADAIGRAVIVGPIEATAVGNILVQAMGTGRVSDLPHLRRIVASTFHPQRYAPREPQAWEEPSRRFRDLLATEVSVE
ncbi:MAG: rhamnulokinase family protein [Planctomycetota bacterium]|nr:rhamnulokinase family protein [Planctomycetota bacterium]